MTKIVKTATDIKINFNDGHIAIVSDLRSSYTVCGIHPEWRRQFINAINRPSYQEVLAKKLKISFKQLEKEKKDLKEEILEVTDTINNKNKSAILFELDKSEYYVEINKSDWKQALQSCIDKLIETEDYEMCIQMQDLIDKIN